jgi:hypothetical protein
MDQQDPERKRRRKSWKEMNTRNEVRNVVFSG